MSTVMIVSVFMRGCEQRWLLSWGSIQDSAGALRVGGERDDG